MDMRYRELREYLTLKNDELFYEIEISRLNKLLNQEVSLYSSPSLDGVPSGHNVSSPTERIAIASLECGEKYKDEIKQYKDKLTECREKIKAIVEFIEAIPDAEAKAFLRRNILQNVSFRQLAREKFVSRNYVAKKIYQHCEK